MKNIEDMAAITKEEAAEYTKLYSQEAGRTENRLSLCWAFAKRDVFSGDRSKTMQWIKTVFTTNDPGEIGWKLDIGEMIAHFRNNPELFYFLLSFPHGKNRDILSIPLDRLEEFIKDCTSERLNRISREDLRKSRDQFLGKHKSKKPEKEKLFQPDLFRCLEKSAKTDDPEDFRRAMERIEKKNKLEYFRKAFYLQARLMYYDKELATVEGSKEALDMVLSLLDQVKAKDQPESALPVKSEPMPPAIRKERREVTMEDFERKTASLQGSALSLCKKRL